MTMERLVRIDWYSGRGGDVWCWEIMDEERYAELRDLVDSQEEFYQYEVLGKHSELVGTLSEEDVTVLSSEPGEIALVRKLFGKRGGNFDLDGALECVYYRRQERLEEEGQPTKC